MKQKSINSLQSIFMLEARNFSWTSDSSKKLLNMMILKAGDENLQIAKAAAQCLHSLCKHDGVKETAALLSIGALQKFIDFLNAALVRLPTTDIKVSVDDILEII